MFYSSLSILKTILIISCFQLTHSWTSQCSPCKCYQQTGPKQLKVTDCSNSVTNFQQTKIPQLQEETESIFLVGQHLNVIPEHAFFKGLKNNLKFVDLKNCKVRLVNSYAFKNLENLSGLDLSYNLITELDENIFSLNYKLKILILQNNDLKILPEKLLYNLSELKYLDVSNNNLHYIYPNQFKNNVNLERLILQSNYLTQFDQKLIANLQKLNVLYLDNNPWKCDCQTRDLQKLLINRKIDFVYNNIYPLCLKPEQYKNKKWLEVKPKELCSVPTTQKINVYEGDVFEFNCNIIYQKNVEIEWFLDGKQIDLKNTKKYEILNINNNYKLKVYDVQNNDKGVYKCWTNNIKGTGVQFDETVLDVQPSVKPTIDGPKYTKKIVRKGTQNYNLNCPVSGTPKPEIQWLFNNQILSLPTKDCNRKFSALNNNLEFSIIESSCFGNYTCKAKNSKGVAEIKYDLSPIPDKPEIEPIVNVDDNNNAVEGTTIKLNCYVSEAVLLEVSWLRNGEKITSNNKFDFEIKPVGSNRYNYILIIKDISDGESGKYKCRANTVDSTEYNLNVKPAIEPSIDDFDTNNEIILEHGANKDVPCNVKGVKNPSIIWELPSCNQYSFSESHILHLRNVNCPGKYKCIVNTPKGTIEKEFKLSLIKPKIIDINIVTNYSDKNIYENDDIILTCLIDNVVDSVPFWIFTSDGKLIENDLYHELIKVPLGKNKYSYNLKLKSVNQFISGEYRCSIGSEAEYIDVNVQKPNPPKIEEISNPVTYVESGTKDFKMECKVSGAHTVVLWTSTNNLCPFEQIIEDRDNYKVAILIIKEVTRSCSAKYKCTTNSKLGKDEKNVDLNIVSLEPPQPEIETNTIDKEISENDEIVLKCLIRGAITTKPEWRFVGFFNPKKYKIITKQISETSYWYNLVIKDLKPEDAKNYLCVLGNHEKNIYLDVKPLVKPNIEYISANQTVEVGKKNLTIECKITKGAKTKSRWLRHNEINNCDYEISKDKNNDWIYLTFNEITSSCAGVYSCIASNSKGESQADVNIFVISTNEPPLVELDTFDSNNMIENEDVTIKCFINAYQINQPKWLYEGREIFPNNKYRFVINPFNHTSYWFNLVISKISAEEQGSYKCSVNNFESEIKINVQKGLSPVIEYISETSKVEEGKKDFSLSCRVNAIPIPEVSWYHNENKIEKSNLNKCTYHVNSEINNNTVWLYLYFNNVEPECAGRYKCVSSNSKGGANSEINLSVVELQPPEIIQPHKEIFENENITLQCLIKNSIDSKPYWMHNKQVININDKYKIVMVPINETNYWYNLEILNILPSNAGNYKCKINNFERNIPIHVQPSTKPYFERIPPTNIELEEDSSTRLSCQAAGKPAPEIIWLFENTPIIKTNTHNNCLYKIETNTLIINNATNTCSGKYKCIARNFKGNVAREMTVKVNTLPPPTIEVVPTADKEISENGQVVLKCLVPHRKYIADWYRKEVIDYMEPNSKYEIIIDPVEKSTAYWYNLVISNLSLDDAGKYKCKINNLESSVDLDIKPSEKPFIEYILPTDSIVTEGIRGFKLACKVLGNPRPQIKWNLENNNCKHLITSDKINNTELNYLNILEVTQECAGKYKCIASNSAGFDSKEIVLSVVSSNQIPEISMTSTSEDGTIREHDNITIRCLTTGNENAKVDWYHNGKLINLKDSRYEIKNQKVNTLTTWYILTINNANINDIGDYSCKTNNIQESYNLEIDHALKPSVEYLTKSKYIVDENKQTTTLACKIRYLGHHIVEWTLNDIPVLRSKCANTNGIEVDYKTFKHFYWYNLTIFNIKTECSGKYKCSIKNLDDHDNNAIDLIVLPNVLPEIQVSSNDKNILENDSITLKCFITSSSINAKWFFGKREILENEKYKLTRLIINDTSYWYNLEIPKISIQDSGNYICKTRNSEITQSIVVNPGFKPVIEFHNSDMIIEEGIQELTLFCKAKGSPLPNIQWSLEPKSNFQSGECKLKSTYEQNSNTQWNYLKITNIKASCSGRIQCKASNSKGTSSEYVNLTVIPIQKPKITVNSTSADKIIREGDDVTLSCLATGKNNIPAKWFFKAKYGNNQNHNFRFSNYEINPLTYQYDLIIKNISIERAGRYFCERNSAKTFIDINVQFGIPPSIDHFPNSETVVSYVGTMGPTLYCKGFGSPKPNIVWLFNDKPIEILQKTQCKLQFNTDNYWNNLTITYSSHSCAGNYKCVAENIKGRTEKNIPVRVIQIKKPEIQITNSNDNEIITEDDEVILKCLVRGDFTTNVLWLYNGKIIKIDDNHKIIKEKYDDISFWYNLHIKQVSSTHEGNYQCKTPVSETDINLNVNQMQEPIVKITGPNKVFIEKNAKELTLQCSGNGVPTPFITWTLNNKPIETLSQCTHGCQYHIQKINNQWLYLTLTNITELCSGRYNCIAENSALKVHQYVDVVVVPKNQPEVSIEEPVHVLLNTDVTVTCKVVSVDQPLVNWKCHDKSVDLDKSKYSVRNSNRGNDLHYYYLTIKRFQQSDSTDCTCVARIHNQENKKTISLKPKVYSKPKFVNSVNLWNNFQYINGDLIFTTQVKGFPMPTLKWTHDDDTNIIIPDTTLKNDTKYLSKISYIKDDTYWFNQTIKNFSIGPDSGTHSFIMKNYLGVDDKQFYVDTEQQYNATKGKIEILIDYNKNVKVPEAT